MEWFGAGSFAKMERPSLEKAGEALQAKDKYCLSRNLHRGVSVSDEIRMYGRKGVKNDSGGIC